MHSNVWMCYVFWKCYDYHLWLHLLSPPSKYNSIKLLSTIWSLLCGNLGYMVEKSEVEIEVACCFPAYQVYSLYQLLVFCSV